MKQNTIMNTLTKLAILLVATASSFANAKGFECKAGIDSMNKPAAFIFTLDDETDWYDAVLDEENRIRFSCSEGDYFGDKVIRCTIGQVPESAPQNHMNMDGGSFAMVGIESKFLYLEASSFRTIKSEKYINFTPYVYCKRIN